MHENSCFRKICLGNEPFKLRPQESLAASSLAKETKNLEAQWFRQGLVEEPPCFRRVFKMGLGAH